MTTHLLQNSILRPENLQAVLNEACGYTFATLYDWSYSRASARCVNSSGRGRVFYQKKKRDLSFDGSTFALDKRGRVSSIHCPVKGVSVFVNRENGHARHLEVSVRELVQHSVEAVLELQVSKGHVAFLSASACFHGNVQESKFLYKNTPDGWKRARRKKVGVSWEGCSENDVPEPVKRVLVGDLSGITDSEFVRELGETLHPLLRMKASLEESA